MATESSADTRRGDVAVPAQPCRDGGYELALPTWLAVVIELARGCPSAEDFPIEVSQQFDLMAGNPEPDPLRLRPEHERGRAGVMKAALLAAIREPFVVEDIDYLDPEDVVVPAHMAVDYDWKDYDMPTEGTIGYRLHGNPMYLARSLTFFYGELNATQVGTARAALEEYERLMHDKPTSFPPPMPRTESADFQRWFGEASSLVASAEILLLGAIDRYRRKCAGWAQHGEPFTPAQDAALRDVVAQAGRLACQAVDLMFTTGGSSAAKRGSRLQRYFRDAAMFRTHIAAQYDIVSASTGRVLLGQPLTH